MLNVCSVAQACPALYSQMDYSLPDSSVTVLPKQEFWSGCHFPQPGDRPNSGTVPHLSTLVLADRILYY